MTDEFRPVTMKDAVAATAEGLLAGLLIGGATYVVNRDWQVAIQVAGLAFGVIVTILLLLMAVIWVVDAIRWRKWRADNSGE